MKVKNINGTSQNNCKCGSWLKHWEKFSGRKAYSCSAEGCYGIEIVGAHVQKDSLYDSNWYIVPFCYSHNRSVNKVELKIGVELVSANKEETCEG